MRLTFTKRLEVQSTGRTLRFDVGRTYEVFEPLASFAQKEGYAAPEAKAIGPAPENMALPGAPARKKRA